MEDVVENLNDGPMSGTSIQLMRSTFFFVFKCISLRSTSRYLVDRYKNNPHPLFAFNCLTLCIRFTNQIAGLGWAGISDTRMARLFIVFILKKKFCLTTRPRRRLLKDVAIALRSLLN